jgi:hypothetical protein
METVSTVCPCGISVRVTCFGTWRCPAPRCVAGTMDTVSNGYREDDARNHRFGAAKGAMGLISDDVVGISGGRKLIGLKTSRSRI